jgi:hypothetical protein
VRRVVRKQKLAKDWLGKSWWATLTIRMDEIAKVIQKEYPHVVIPVHHVKQSGRNTFEIYLEHQHAAIYMSYVAKLCARDICFKTPDNNSFVEKAKIEQLPSALSSGSIRQQFIVMGLDKRHLEEDVNHMLKQHDPDMPPVTLSILRQFVHSSVIKLNGGAGGVCLSAPVGTMQTAPKFAELVNSFRYLRYGHSKIFFFTPDVAKDGMGVAEPSLFSYRSNDTAQSSSTSFVGNHVTDLQKRLNTGTYHTHIVQLNTQAIMNTLANPKAGTN